MTFVTLLLGGAIALVRRVTQDPWKLQSAKDDGTVGDSFVLWSLATLALWPLMVVLLVWHADAILIVGNEGLPLPVLVPKLTYQALAIQEGGTASETWNKIVTGELDAEGIARERDNLLKYCGLNSLAMVQIWRVLHTALTRDALLTPQYCTSIMLE